MGSWHLEVARMALYIGFPIAMFHIFNQPQLFEKWIIELKQEVFPPESDPDIQNLRAGIEEFKKKQNEHAARTTWREK